MKSATPKNLSELKECTACHSFAKTGFELRGEHVSRFVCEECYERLKEEYPICSNMLEIKQSILTQIVPGLKKPTFQAGYLLGKKEVTDNITKVTITHYINSLQAGRGSVIYFGRDDIMKVRKFSKENNCSVVAIFRTSPSGLPDFNALDDKILTELTQEMPYVIVAGNSEIQIGVRDKNYPTYEYGVTVV